MDSIPVVIFAGGRGERLRPRTDSVPKALLPTKDGKPMLGRVMESLHRQKFEEFFLLTHHLAGEIQKHEEKSSYLSECVREPKPLGTAGGLRLLKDRLPDQFVVANCDSLITKGLDKIVQQHVKENRTATLVVANQRYRIPYGVIQTREMYKGQMAKMQEKPEISHLVYTGVAVLAKRALKWLPSGPSDMATFIARLGQVSPVHVSVVESGIWKDLALEVE